jgi:hypothetical protein
MLQHYITAVPYNVTCTVNFMSQRHTAVSCDILYIVQCTVGRKGEWGKLVLLGYLELCVVWKERFVILIYCT